MRRPAAFLAARISGLTPGSPRTFSPELKPSIPWDHGRAVHGEEDLLFYPVARVPVGIQRNYDLVGDLLLHLEKRIAWARWPSTCLNLDRQLLCEILTVTRLVQFDFGPTRFCYLDIKLVRLETQKEGADHASDAGSGSPVANFALRSFAIRLDATQMDEEDWRHRPREVLPSY